MIPFFWRHSAGLDGPSDWALVDCRLTKSSGAYYRIRDVIRKKAVADLKFVCLTHPDLDHFFGMKELLEERFIGPGGQLNVSQFWDSGAYFGALSALAERRGAKLIRRQLDDLYSYLKPFILGDAVAHWAVGSHSQPDVDFGEFKLIALSPTRNQIDRFHEREVEAILTATPEEIRYRTEESNDLSVVLVLMHKRLPLNIILGADATARVWTDALDTWGRAVKKHCWPEPRFVGVKVSHHGAKGSVAPALYENHCKARSTIAVLSVGPNDPDHPHPDVLNLLRQRKIRTFATCWPTGISPPKPTLPLPGYRVPTSGPATPQMSAHDWADVEITIRSDGPPEVGPRKSKLRLT